MEIKEEEKFMFVMNFGVVIDGKRKGISMVFRLFWLRKGMKGIEIH